MRYWKLPAWADPRRALKVLNSAAAEGGVVQSLNERAKELQGRRLEEVELPGFHLFDYGGTTPPYSWMMPKLQGSHEDLVGYWEMYVGEVSDNWKANLDPLRSVRDDRTVLTASAFSRFFGKRRKGTHWATPAAKIIALTQRLPGQEGVVVEVTPAQRIEQRRIRRIATHVGNFYMEVTPKGLFTNYGQSARTISFPPGDGTLNELCVRSVRTRHPLAIAISECDEAPHALTQAAAVVFRALAVGQLNESAVSLSGASAGRAPKVESIEAALQYLQGESPSLRHLYDILVPSAMDSRRFRYTFGNPFRPLGRVRKSTVERWAFALYDLAP